MIEVYGRQEDLPDGSGDLSTQELMLKSGGLISGGAKVDKSTFIYHHRMVLYIVVCSVYSPSHKFLPVTYGL